VAVVRVGSLPKTSSGKVQRRRTKTLFEQGQLEEHPQ
jgi:fatty-acyl-CoA synthase